MYINTFEEFKINPVDQCSVRRHMTALVEYVKAMRMSLQEINSHSYNNFMLRVGKIMIREDKLSNVNSLKLLLFKALILGLWWLVS